MLDGDKILIEGRALIACPQCDMLHFEPDIPEDHTATCIRCGQVLAAPRTNAYLRVLSLATTAVILMVGAVFFPFIELEAAGLHNTTSVIDAILAFSTGLMLPLSFAVAMLIVLIPVTRFAAIIYTIWPLVRNRKPFAGASEAFRLAEFLRPWSMAEIFIVGVSVALVKVAGLATVSFGPAFWAFAGLVVVTVLQDNSMCRYTIWKSLEQNRA
ncbi:paraquat-inducible protein A [Psychromarinibacter sp. S121]|uniref:paraquat-inducible protein A n=1 Tax=Psychromarinibacter sp. S121 TaxID=3415127 RepID=UPI003C7CA51B